MQEVAALQWGQDPHLLEQRFQQTNAVREVLINPEEPLQRGLPHQRDLLERLLRQREAHRRLYVAVAQEAVPERVVRDRVEVEDVKSGHIVRV